MREQEGASPCGTFLSLEFNKKLNGQAWFGTSNNLFEVSANDRRSD